MKFINPPNKDKNIERGEGRNNDCPNKTEEAFREEEKRNKYRKGDYYKTQNGWIVAIIISGLSSCLIWKSAGVDKESSVLLFTTSLFKVKSNRKVKNEKMKKYIGKYMKERDNWLDTRQNRP